VLGVWVTVLIVGVALLALLWGGTAFLQSYFYTEVSTAIFWQAPAAAAALTLFYGLWCLLDYSAAESRPGYLPYDTIFRFSAEETKETKDRKPVEYLWAVKKVGSKEEKIRYKRYTVGQGKYQYFQEMMDRSKGPPWRGTGVVALLVPEEGGEVRYDLTKPEQGANWLFVSPDGWTIMYYDDGPTGEPIKSSTGLWLVNLLLNVVHFGLWFVCLWLLLRFQFSHALGLAFVLWLVMTIVVVPMMLVRAGDAALEARQIQRQASAQQQSPRVATRGLALGCPGHPAISPPA
jgi:hypothetical protein